MGSAQTQIGAGEAGDRMPTLESLCSQAAAGERLALAKLLTAVERGEDLAELIPVREHSVDAWKVLGVTGAPGVGKSCLVDRLVKAWVDAGGKVAILAIDPSSPVSGGALLGDRMRMSSVDEGQDVYLRSIATRNLPGGLPARIDGMLDALVSAGFSHIIVETVGAGQSEVRIIAVADRILLVEGPARGDVIQAEKAGVMELADLIAVNKSDLEGAEKAAEEIRMSMQLSEVDDGAPVILCSAHTGDGISELVEALDNLPNARGAASARARERLLAAWTESLLLHPGWGDALKSVESGEVTVREVIRDLLGHED